MYLFINATNMWRVFWWLCYGRPADPARRPKAGQANSEATSAIACANSALRGRTGNFGCGKDKCHRLSMAGPWVPEKLLIDVYCGKAHAIDIHRHTIWDLCYCLLFSRSQNGDDLGWSPANITVRVH